MNLLLDTNIVLDFILPNRSVRFPNSKIVLQSILNEQHYACMTASSLTDIFYLTGGNDKKQRPQHIARARAAIKFCLDYMTILPITHELLRLAYAVSNGDFEDDLQIISAQEYNCDAIITRDIDGFSHAPILVLSPTQFVLTYL